MRQRENSMGKSECSQIPSVLLQKSHLTSLSLGFLISNMRTITHTDTPQELWGINQILPHTTTCHPKGSLSYKFLYSADALGE